MHFSFVPIKSRQLTPQEQLRQAVLSFFCNPPLPSSFPLLQLPVSQWRAMLPWLDTSGLALYLYDRLSQLQMLGCLPDEISVRLTENLRDNTERQQAMLTEAVEIQEQFQRRKLGYLLLKGFSLLPLSVPRLELRSQLDLDFLVTAESIGPARKVLEERGFVLHAVSGRSWEFKTPFTHSGSLRDLYRANQARSVELHVEAPAGSGRASVQDGEWRNICGFQMPVLSPVPLFLGQAAHLYKHVSTGFFRCSHLLELYRHTAARRGDSDFWHGVEEAVSSDGRLALSLGVTSLLLSRVMELEPPDALAECSSRLEPPIRLWAEKIGPRCVYASWPGTKLHLLLQREIAGGESATRSQRWRGLVPRRMPPAIAPAPGNETFSSRVLRSMRQARYVMFRMRYHIVTGLQYAWELALWKRQLRQAMSHANVTPPAARKQEDARFARQTKE